MSRFPVPGEVKGFDADKPKAIDWLETSHRKFDLARHHELPVLCDDRYAVAHRCSGRLCIQRWLAVLLDAREQGIVHKRGGLGASYALWWRFLAANQHALCAAYMLGGKEALLMAHDEMWRDER